METMLGLCTTAMSSGGEHLLITMLSMGLFTLRKDSDGRSTGAREMAQPVKMLTPYACDWDSTLETPNM